MKNPKSILITGASSGIGEALARLYAAPGVTLALGGRDVTRLDAVAAACRERGADAHARPGDVTDAEATASWIADSDRHAALDLVIANAGISAGTGGAGEGADQARRILAVNVGGVMNTVFPAIAVMRARRRGQIAVMASLAGFRGMPGAPAYCASKATIRIWGEGLRGELRGDGIEVSVICPGFVRSPMTAANPFPMPLLMDAERAAVIIRRGLGRDRARIAFPFPLYVLAWGFAALPAWLSDVLLPAPPARWRKPSG